jgi:LacI family transcriptional regulator
VNSLHRITLKDVAARAKLSVAAVSMALRDHPSLPPATAARVKKVAAAMGYAPDPALSALAAHRTRLRVRRDFSVIALVSNYARRHEWLRRESAQRLLAGATARARALGYALEHLWAREDDMSPARFSEVLVARGIRGIILAPFAHPTDAFELDWRHFAVVTVERPTRYTFFPHVVTNYFADTVLAWSQFHARGYRRIGLVVNSGLAERTAHQWEAAHTFEQTRLKADPVPTLIVGEAGRPERIRAWLRQHRPDAVLCRSEGVLEAAAAEGRRIPRDLGYASLNVLDDAPGVSGILQRRDVMGATAVDVIHGLLHRNHRGPHTVSSGTHIDGVWHEGRTLRAAGKGRPPHIA